MCKSASKVITLFLNQTPPSTKKIVADNIANSNL